MVVNENVWDKELVVVSESKCLDRELLVRENV